MRRTRIVVAVLVLALAGLAPVIAQARSRHHAHAARLTHVAVGIGDQHSAMFTNRNFQRLNVHRARYFIPWDAIRHRNELRWADAYVADARAHGVSVLLHITTNTYRYRRAHLPSVGQYRRDVGALIRRYRAMGVSDWGVWNEENHKSEPTYRNPRRAAQFFEAMWSMCRGCNIVALDLLDQSGSNRYERSFFRSMSRRWRSRVRVIGIHNYEDTNHRRTSGTRTIIHGGRAYNRRVVFWLTETGGLVHFGRRFPCNTRRAGRAIDYMFSLARRYRGYLRRLYVYAWTGTNCRGFDAGLTDRRGHLRPGYTRFRLDARGFTR